MADVEERFEEVYDELRDELEELYMIAEDVLRSNPDVTGEELKDWYGYYFSRLDASDYQSIIDEVRELNESINDEKDINLNISLML